MMRYLGLVIRGNEVCLHFAPTNPTYSLETLSSVLVDTQNSSPF